MHVYRKYGFTPSREFACFKSGQRPFIPFSARVPTEEIPPAQALADHLQTASAKLAAHLDTLT